MSDADELARVVARRGTGGYGVRPFAELDRLAWFFVLGAGR